MKTKKGINNYNFLKRAILKEKLSILEIKEKYKSNPKVTFSAIKEYYETYKEKFMPKETYKQYEQEFDEILKERKENEKIRNDNYNEKFKKELNQYKKDFMQNIKFEKLVEVLCEQKGITNYVTVYLEAKEAVGYKKDYYFLKFLKEAKNSELIKEKGLVENIETILEHAEV